MSSRALRKAQREKEEQDRLKQLEKEAQDLEEDDEDDEPAVSAPRKSAFEMLQDEDEADADEPDDEAEGSDTAPAEALPTPVTNKSSSKKKKKKKKAKASEHAADSPPPDKQLDEIDAALKELSTKGYSAHSGTTAAGVDPIVNEVSRLLAIDTNHLHAQNEMRRLFGRAALESQEDEQPEQQQAVGGNRRQQRRVQQVGLAQALRGQRADGRSGGLAAMALRRNIFISGKEEWPVATGGGLGMEVEEKRADGTVLYRFAHNTAYQDVQSQFETRVASMDPNRLVALLRLNPYHISTLLQVSEIAKSERDHATSGDLLERALFSFGRAVHSTFAKNLSEGKARLDFRRAENREFWLASWRYMQNLTMRATWRTVYEWARLLLSLSPEDDPYALWLVLDQYALRSRQDLDYLNMSRNASFKAVHHDMPNVQLSQGLAEYRAGNQGKGKQVLFTAIGRFPWVVARLMHELGLDAPPAVWGKEPRTQKEKFYAELYTAYAKDLWNTPEASNLLVEVASAVPAETPAAPVNADEITQNEARHALLSDNTTLIALVPRKFTAQLESSSDPLPPDDAFMSYLSRRTGRSRGGGGTMGLNQIDESVREIQSLHRFFAELFPWFRRPFEVQNEDPENTDGAADEAGQPPASHQDLMRQVDAAGVPRQVFQDRAQRLVQLQDQLFGGGPEVGTEVFERLAMDAHFGHDDDADADRPNQPRVEEGSDDE
ncbi:hypothetical protein PRZ48_012363 [Zasmidium cellare]|uniref:DUF654-domain-containing protein n=1 Tax=Zasmidium cellare TaxID=395010 RepID=A0ABR0E4N4_ZASCE|nr:hypothetical protein PRZ48_012363 [Zasmidium cellare]